MYFEATDGYPLAGTWVGPVRADRVALIIPATGVLRRYYVPFAETLAMRGYRVLTWDWRGIGGSRRASVKHSGARMIDWAQLDLAGALHCVRETHPKASVVGIGHSFGGQAVGLAAGAERLQALVTIGSQSGYWGHWPAPARYAYAMLWKAGVPALTRLMGYFPGELLGVGQDLPKGVALQWAQWCRSPDYLGDYGGHAAFKAPILSLAFSDDAFAPRRAVRALHQRYSSAPVEHWDFCPADLGVRRIGHFGFFREGCTPSLWHLVGEWIDQVVASQALLNERAARLPLGFGVAACPPTRYPAQPTAAANAKRA